MPPLIGFKLFRLVNGERTALFFSDIKYPLYKWSRPWKGCGPIFLFSEERDAAVMFRAWFDEVSLEMWKVEYKAWERPFLTDKEGPILGWRRGRLGTVRFCDISQGTAFASAIRPVERVAVVIN